MEIKKSDRGKCGIYLIRNVINGKVYIGASLNIGDRLRFHIRALRLKLRKSENEHFINSWHKHGEHTFTYIVLEECTKDLLRSREFFWTNYYGSTNPKLGFNKRMDSENGMITHPETSARLKNSSRWNKATQEMRDAQAIITEKFWRDNPDKKTQMAKNVKLTRQEKYKFIQLNEEENTIKEYNTMEDIIKENPTYKWQNIYAVCNGYKKRIYGFKWRKELK